MTEGPKMDYRKIEGDDGGLKVSYEVLLPCEEAQTRVDEIYAFLAMQSGVDYIANQPKEALLKRFGEDVGERVLSCLANQCVDKLIALEELPAALEPVVLESSFDEEKGFSASVQICLKPVLELTSYDPVELSLPEPKITDEMIEREMARMVAERARYVEDGSATEVARDTACVVTVDTKKFGMQVDALTAKGVIYRIGDGLLPKEIEGKLLGMAPGEQKRFSFTLTSKNFLGLDVEEPMDCTLTVERIVRKDTPELDDEWVRDHIPGAHSVETFREGVKRNLLDWALGDYRRLSEETAVSSLAKRLPEVELPEIYYEYSRAGLLQNISAALSRQGMTREMLYEAQGVSESQFMAQMRARAIGIVKQGLALDALARHEGIILSEEDYLRALRSISSGNEDETRRMLEMNGRLYQLRESAMRSKARTWLMDHVKRSVSK